MITKHGHKFKHDFFKMYMHVCMNALHVKYMYKQCDRQHLNTFGIAVTEVERVWFVSDLNQAADKCLVKTHAISVK